MALTRTTLSAALGIDDIYMTVASATGMAAGRLVRIDQEFIQIGQSYSSGTLVGPLLRGRNGSAGAAHAISAGVVVGTQADDFDAPGAGVDVNSPIGGRARYIRSITADNSSVTLQPAGSDQTVILNGTSVINLTVPIPTTDMDGDELAIMGNGTAAHVITFTGGLGGEGTSYDVLTFNASGPVATKVVACNAVWLAFTQPAWTGTVTNLVAAIA